MEQMDFKSKFLDFFNRKQANFNGALGGSWSNLAQDASDYFMSNGIPTLKNEHWKYTNVGFLNRLKFNFAEDLPATDVDDEWIDSVRFNTVDCELAVVINGKYSPKHSHVSDSIKGVTIMGFREAVQKGLPEVTEYFGKLAKYDANPFAAVNTALAQDGVFIKIDKNIIPEKVIHVIFIDDARENDIFTNSRKLFVIGENAEVKILESHKTIGDKNAVKNTVTEVVLSQNAKLDYYKIQNDSDNSHYFGTTHVLQQKSSLFNTNTISLNGKFIRNNLNVTLEGEGAESHFFGLFMPSGTSLFDSHTMVDHAVPNCFSNENYRGILDDRGTGVFNGKILVRKDAQKTNAYQSNKNIILSQNATINTKPELEIYADDVKCSHGATSGTLDEESMFYLKTRGIPTEKAKSLLLYAFAGEILENIKIGSLHDEISRIIANRIGVEID